MGGRHLRTAAARRLPGHPVQRRRPPARRYVGRVDLGHTRVSVPPALRAAPVARPGWRAHPQGAGSADARRARLPHPVHALAGPADLHGRPAAPAGLRAAHLDRVLHRPLDRQHLEDYDHAPQGRLPEARRAADERSLHDDGVHHPPRQHPDDHERGGRPRLHGRAVCALHDLRLRPDRHHGERDVQRVGVRRERRHRSALGAALPAGPEHGPRRLAEERAVGARSGRARRRCHALPRIQSGARGSRGGADAARAVVQVGGRRREEHRRPEPQGRPGARAAGAGQRLHAGSRRREPHCVGRRRGRAAGQHRRGGDVGQGARGARPAGQRHGDAADRPTAVPASTARAPGAGPAPTSTPSPPRRARPSRSASS